MLTSGLNPNVVKTALDTVFNTEFNYETLPGRATVNDELCFMQDMTDRSAVIVEQFQGTGYFEQASEQGVGKESTPLVGNQQTHTVLKWKNTVEVPEDFADDEQHGVVKKMIQSMARNARLTQDKHAFNQFNLGFTTVLSNDSVALFNNSHTTLAGDTVDNLVSGALSESTLNDAIVQLMEQKTQDGTVGAHEPALLLVPTALFKTAQEITKSELRSGTGNNDLNYYSQIFPGLQVKHSPFLGAAQGGSDTAWFLLSRNHSMMRYVRKPITTSFVPGLYQRNDNSIYKAKYREVVAPISFEGMVGSTGA